MVEESEMIRFFETSKGSNYENYVTKATCIERSN
jgi:hypothetical protein